MFNFSEIWAYPTDTSFGLGVRADDAAGLKRLAALKGNREGKYFSLMCADEKMLRTFAHVPEDFDVYDFFFTKPRTAIFQPTQELPQSKFWPNDKVAFRVSTIPEIAKQIEFPVTATSANKSGEEPIFTIEKLREVFDYAINIYNKIPKLPQKPPSEMWDFTIHPPKQIR
jgi:L-threonylcarbamoyladenylate synthase